MKEEKNNQPTAATDDVSERQLTCSLRTLFITMKKITRKFFFI